MLRTCNLGRTDGWKDGKIDEHMTDRLDHYGAPTKNMKHSCPEHIFPQFAPIWLIPHPHGAFDQRVCSALNDVCISRVNVISDLTKILFKEHIFILTNKPLFANS